MPHGSRALETAYVGWSAEVSMHMKLSQIEVPPELTLELSKFTEPGNANGFVAAPVQPSCLSPY